jgi:hypothetical protein
VRVNPEKEIGSHEERMGEMENYIFLKYICESFLPLKGLLHHSDII